MILIPFDFDGQSIRAQTDDRGEPWFNAGDVCGALGFTNPWKAVADHVDDDDLTKREVIDSMGRGQLVNHISESGLYALIFGSKLESAKRFKRWVTSEVLPAIRKHGGFSGATRADPKLQGAAVDAEAVLSFMRAIGLDNNAAAISANQAVIKTHGVNLLELSGNTHLIAANQEDKALTVTELGEAMGGIGARQVNKLLESAGLQTKAGKEWVPTPAADGLCRLLDTGKRHGSGAPVTQLKWFQAVAGRLKIAA